MAIVRGARYRIHWHRNRTNFCCAKEACNELDRIRQRDQHAVARRTARIEQRVSHAIYFELKRTVTCFSLDTKDCRIAGMLARRPGDEFIRNVECTGRRYRRLRHGGDSTSQAILLLHRNCQAEEGGGDPNRLRTVGDPTYCVADFSPSRRMRSCSFLRRLDGALGLNATRYHSGCVRSRLSRVNVAASLFG